MRHSRRVRTALMADFDHQIREGFAVVWLVSVAGYAYEPDGPLPYSFGLLVDLEHLIATMTQQYERGTGAQLVRVHGTHGERVFHWSDGAVHRYTWRHEVVDLRCSTCQHTENDMYMVTDELWRASGLDGRACYRCLEAAVGRRLVPADFKPGVPANTDDLHHGSELRARMGLP